MEKEEESILSEKKYPPPPAKKNYLFIIIIVFCLLFIPLFNFFVDPYKIFFRERNALPPSTYNEERDTIWQRLKTDQNSSYDFVMIGDSNTDLCFDENDFKNITNKSLTKVTLKGISLQEQLSLLKAYIQLHPDTKNIIISINFIAFLNEYENRLPLFSNKENITFREYCKILFTTKALSSSISVFKEYYLTNLYFKTVTFIRENKYLNRNPLIQNFRVKIIERVVFPKLKIKLIKKENQKINYNKNIQALKSLSQFLNEKKINAIFIINATHTYTLCNIYKNGYWDTYMKFKTDIANIITFWDFSIVNKYNNTPITLKNLYWDDVMHSTKYYGKLMLQNIFEENTNFGMKINKNNVKEATNQQTILIKDFINNNKTTVDKYMKNKIDDFSNEIKYTYF